MIHYIKAAYAWNFKVRKIDTCVYFTRAEYIGNIGGKEYLKI